MATTAASLVSTSDYHQLGYAFPIPVMDPREATELASRVQAYAENEDSAHYLIGDAQLVFKFVDELVRRDVILDAVESVLGPDVMLLRASFFIKQPHTLGHVAWHQDLTYWGLDRDEEVTAWVAFSPATEASGCMRFVPGSHRHGIVEHVDTDDASNLLSRSQVLKVEVDESTAVRAELQAGEMSLHHGQIYHASGPNRTDQWRIGLAVRYVSPRMQQVVGSTDHAALVRGEDRYHHFLMPPRPVADLDPAATAYFDQVKETKKEFLFQDQN